MEKDFLKRIKNELNNDMKSMSFKSEGLWFIRIINNEIYQSLWFQSVGKCFTFNIGIMPLCGQYRGNKVGNIRIGPSINEGKDKWWNYSDESIKEVIDIIRQRVIPLFNQISTYKDLYNYLENQFIITKRQERDFTNLSTYVWDFIGNKDLTFLCFKLKKYEKALINIKNGIDEIQNVMSINVKDFDNQILKAISVEYANKYTNDKKEYINFMNRKIDELKKIEKLIKEKEYDKLLSVISQNENQNVTNLQKYIIKKQ